MVGWVGGADPARPNPPDPGRSHREAPSPMLRPIRRAVVAPIGIALVALLALPLSVLANTSEAIAQTGGMTVTLPMPGSGLSVVVKLDVVGNVSQVDLDPVGTYSATKVGPHAVTFENGDGTSQVKIKAGGDRLAVKASAPTLASFLGSGTWSADVFGTGVTTKVGYTVGDLGGGKPTVKIDSVDAPGDIGVVQGTEKTKTGPKGSSASIGITFSRDGFNKKLDISVSVKAAGDHPASFKITLSGKDKQKLTGTLADLIGVHSWAGHLCDGTAVGFTYTVADPGTVAFGAASGAPATSKSMAHGISVRFDGTKMKVQVRLIDKKDGTWALKVSSQTSRCRHTPAADPTVNTPVKPGAGDHGGGHDGSGDRHDGPGFGGGYGDTGKGHGRG